MVVSEWMKNGNINQFVEANINADRLGLVCYSFNDVVFTDDHVATVA